MSEIVICVTELDEFVNFDCGVEKPGPSRHAHNVKLIGSNPITATI